jgi:hypothetical protein
VIAAYLRSSACLCSTGAASEIRGSKDEHKCPTNGGPAGLTA